MILTSADGEVEVECLNDQKYKLPTRLRRNIMAGIF